MKVGVLNTIARSIYSDPKVKIREAVANSMDNDATWFIIYMDTPSRTISLMDNGIGITQSRFRDIFSSIGFAVQGRNVYSNSYFGLGLMSILAFGRRATIVTKSRAEGEVTRLEIESHTIFAEDMWDKPISDVGNLLNLRSSDLAERERLSILTSHDITKLIGAFPANFTEIILEDIDEDSFKKVASHDFQIELCKTLPLKVQKNEPFLHSIKDPGVLAWLTQTMNNREFCPTIDVYLGKSGGEKELTELWKYYPNFRSDLELGKADIDYGISDDNMFAYYYLYSTDDLQERSQENRETGFWVRNRNFLVKEADYFERPGSKERIVHEPLKNWLFGEILHRNMTTFLIVTRNEYVWESDEFLHFWGQIRDLVTHLNKRLRDAWKNTNDAFDSIIKPFITIEQTHEPFISYDTLLGMGLVNSEEDLSNILERLNERRTPELEQEGKRIDKLIERGEACIVLADDKTMKVMIDPEVNRSKMVIKQREEKTYRVIVRISPEIFSPQETTLLGTTFTVYYVAGEETSPSVSINGQDHKIYVNPFNQDVSRYSLSFIEVSIATELADLFSNDKREMKEYLLKLLGAKLTSGNVNPRRYLFSLKDELQRRQWGS